MAGTLKTIVIGTSLSKLSDDVVRAGAAVARASGAAVFLIHVFPPSTLPPEVGTADGRLAEVQSEVLREALAEQARRTALDSLPGFDPGRMCLALGSPPREILELAREVKADLLVTGAVEGGALHRILLGSTADQVIRGAHCPVLLARSAEAFPPARVEIPVDLSPASGNALHRGLDLLAGLGMAADDAEVLFVLNPLEVAGSIHFTSEQVERMAARELDRFVAENGPSPVPLGTRVLTGYPRDTILSRLEERKVDLAILGTHGRGGFERLMLGSVASEVVRRAGCNLLVVPPEPGPLSKLQGTRAGEVAV
jgi:nucleotide-binding universal stress UspA family protein